MLTKNLEQSQQSKYLKFELFIKEKNMGIVRKLCHIILKSC